MIDTAPERVCKTKALRVMIGIQVKQSTAQDKSPECVGRPLNAVSTLFLPSPFFILECVAEMLALCNNLLYVIL